MSSITCFLFATASNSRLSIFVALCYAFAISYTSMACCTSTCTSMDSCSSASIMFSSLVAFCIVYASTKCCSTSLSSSNSSMTTKSTNVTLNPVCSPTRQRLLLLHKNSTTDVPVISMS